MKLFFLHRQIKKLGDEPSKHTQFLVQGSEHNISEGGEFLDDAIRMQEQPLMRTEESIAAGSPENLL